MQTLACHQIKYAGEITGVQQLGDHQLMQIAVLSGMQQVSENQVGSTCVTSVACDPYWNNVVLAMHMDGTNGSTTFTDGKGHTVTVVGGAIIRDSISMFGESCSFYEGAAIGHLTSPANGDFNITTGDFTVEAFVYIDAYSPSDSGGNRNACIASYGQSTSDPTGWYFVIKESGIYFNTTSSAISPDNIVGCSVVVAHDTWNHIAISREGSAIKIFLNGISQALSSDDLGGESVSVPAANNLTIGSNPFTSYGWFLQGYIDDLRITKGVARYTSDFTPPTAPFAEVAC